MICLDIHLAVGARYLKALAKLATFVAPFVLHVTTFDTDIGQFFSLVVILVGS